MNIAQIETNLQELIADFNRETFIYDLLLAYGLPKASITRLRRGNLNLSKVDGDISWKKKLYFREEQSEDLHLTISDIAKSLKQDERFVVVTDFTTVLAIDTKTDDRLDIDLQDLPKHYDFFLPWAGMEKAQHASENPADVKAAERMALLFDRIKADNPDESPEFLHGLNVFLSRLLFCYFAEDTHIFEEGQFTNAIASHTQPDGSDLSEYLDKLFEVLNTPENKRENLPEYLNAFPYVNGGLFRDKLNSPLFTRRSRTLLLHGGDQNWAAINPDIFGSMFQASVSVDQRGNLGQHYTSVPNIMKVIEPLFLNELYEEFENGKNEPRKLNNLLNRISIIKIFDPACGSGNFLIIAYKELRLLEIEIIKQLKLLQAQASGFNPKIEQLEFFEIPKAQLSLAASFHVELFSRIQLTQFYGIEIDDFAGEIAKLALWLAEHQMNVEFRKEFGRSNPSLPLTEAGKIVIGNACRLDWKEVCPKNKEDEVYVLGNPPYLGFLQQTKEQKSDMDFVFKGKQNVKKLDYISCWFLLGAKYVNQSKSKLGFVSTNSIIQGEQVALFWPYILNEMNVEIGFAHQSFIWNNSAKSNAGITCVIIGLRRKENEMKYIYKESLKFQADNINAYLSPTRNIFITKLREPLSNLPEISLGSAAYDGGYLMIRPEERKSILLENPKATSLFRIFIGSAEFVRGIERYCLWINDDDLEYAYSIPEIKNRLNNVTKFRLKSKRKQTLETAAAPHRFTEDRHKDEPSLLIPIVTSERRLYMTLGFLSKGEVIPNSARAVYNSEPYLFGVLSSKIHMIWVKAVGGRLRTDVRYSAGVCYNSFPFPSISRQRENELTQTTFRILEEREKHSDKTIAQLYDPEKMPEGLREAHRQNDLIVEKCYRSRPFESDEERLEYLFKLYEQMIEEEKQKDTLFEKKKKRK